MGLTEGISRWRLSNEKISEMEVGTICPSSSTAPSSPAMIPESGLSFADMMAALQKLGVFKRLVPERDSGTLCRGTEELRSVAWQKLASS